MGVTTCLDKQSSSDKNNCALPSDYQPFPLKGALSQNLDMAIEELYQRYQPDGSSNIVSAYNLTTVFFEDGQFRQYGSAPNWQGGYVTLCSCMHQMRSYLSCDDWAKGDRWVAGFSACHGHKALGKPYLLYLAKVQFAFESQSDLYHSNLPRSFKKAKSAVNYIFGDLYEPKQELIGEERFIPNNYEVNPNHVHIQDGRQKYFYKDIDYKGHQTKRRPPLLVCRPEDSFIWTKPTYAPINNLPRSKNYSLSELLQSLELRPPRG